MLLAAGEKKKVKPAGREERKMMSFLVCLWPGKRGKDGAGLCGVRGWEFRSAVVGKKKIKSPGGVGAGGRRREKRKKKAGCRKTGQEKLILCQIRAPSLQPFEHEN